MVDQLTRPIVLLGNPVDHSLSPTMHNAAFEHLGLNLVYLACPVESEDVEAAVVGLRALGAVGANVTVPHKSRVVPVGTRVDEDVRSSGAANTIRFEPDGEICLFNTDVFALNTALGRHGEGRGSALILGAGGAARAAVRALISAGVHSITLTNRTRDTVLNLISDLGLEEPPIPFTTEAITRAAGAADIVINATGLGRGEQAGVDVLDAAVRGASSTSAVVDFVYCPGGTRMERAARSRGLAVVSGLELLFWQGVKSFELWTSVPAPLPVMWRALTGGDDGEIPYSR